MAQSTRIVRQEEVRYLREEVVAAGGVSDIYLGAWTDSGKEGSEQLAIKCFRGAHLSDPEQHSVFTRRLLNEISTWQRAGPHPNILPFLGVLYGGETSVPALITPFRSASNISVFLRRWPDADRCELYIGIVTGLVHLHHLDIVHGNLTPSNILIYLDSSKRVIPQISDLGQTKIMNVEGYAGGVDASSRRYIAPEVLLESHSMRSTHKSDIYSLGMLLLEILSDTPPYPDLGEFQIILALVRNEEPDFNTHDSADRPMSWVWRLLQRCWMFGAGSQGRCTAKKCLSELQAMISGPPSTKFSDPLQTTAGLLQTTIIGEQPQVSTADNEYFELGQPTLKILEDAMASSADAVADPATRYPPRCYPGTRTTPIDRAQQWILDDQRTWDILWLYGPPGVGKSSCAQTIAQFALGKGRLGAAFSFSRLYGCDNFHHVFITLAYQLAVRVPGYLPLVSEQLFADPDLVTKALQVQFRRLIVEPLRSLSRQMKYLIILDGLSECNGVQLQLDIVELINNSTLSPNSLPVIWMMCSRPEPHLVQTFARPDFAIQCWREGLDIDTQESQEDAERFIWARFQEIYEKNRDISNEDSSESWPSEDGIAHIVDAASGHFVLANTILKYIEDPEFGQPDSRLTDVLTVIQASHVAERSSPMETLDLLYRQILSEVPEDIWPLTRRLLRVAIDQASALGPSTPQLLYNFMGISGGQFYAALEGLHSVLEVPLPEDADNQPIRFLHTSFIDYLLDPDRSDQFCIAWSPDFNESDEIQRSSLYFIGSVAAFLAKNLSSNVSLDRERSELAQSRVDRMLSDCLSWPSPDPALNLEFAGVLSHVARTNIFSSYSKFRMDEDHQELINELQTFDFNTLAFTMHSVDPTYRGLPHFICWTEKTSLRGLVRTHSTGEVDDKLLLHLSGSGIDAEPLNMDIIRTRKSFDWFPKSVYFLMGYGTNTVLVLADRGVGRIHAEIKYYTMKTSPKIWPSLVGSYISPAFIPWPPLGVALNKTLEYQEVPRPVATTIVSNIVPYDGDMWGTRSYVRGASDGSTVHFIDSPAPATNPPTRRLRIIESRGEVLVVTPRVGGLYVSVGDTQRAVTTWMRDMEQRARWHGQSAMPTQWAKLLRPEDGKEIEVELWAWRGLEQIGAGLEFAWALQL